MFFSFWAVLSSKVHLVKALVFPVIMYGYKSWTIKKAECRRIDAFELWCLRRLLRVPWTARRSNQCTLKEISPEYLLEGLMLRLKLQYFGHLKNWLIWKDPDAGKDWRWEKGMTEDEMVGWHHQLNDMSLSKLWKLVIDKEAWRAAVHEVSMSQTRLSNWTWLLSPLFSSGSLYLFPPSSLLCISVNLSGCSWMWRVLHGEVLRLL